jgi:hypothetical protein
MLREAGLTNWIREPLDDAVDRRRRIIVPSAAATMGTPLSAVRDDMPAETRHADTVLMMGDNPDLPTMPVTINDIYSFDPDAVVDYAEFDDVVGRHFRQPAEGLGFDGSPVAHMWRTMIWPNNFL